MTEQTLTALYETQAAANVARDGLIQLGVDAGSVMVEGDSRVATGEDKGFWGNLKDVFMPEKDRETFAEGVRRGGYLLTARVAGDEVERAHAVLNEADPIDLDERSSTWRQEGWAGTDDATTTASMAGSEDLVGNGHAARLDDVAEGETLQVAEEELRVGKREVERGAVRVRSYVTERPVEEQVSLREETVRVERRPVNRELRAGDAGFSERTIEMTETDEEAVVAKTARVTEEISLGKQVENLTETVRDTVRKQNVEVVDERTGQGVAAAATADSETIVDTTGRETVGGAEKVTTETTTERPVR